MDQYISEPAAQAPGTPVAAGARAKVFVSYSRKDLAFAETLVGALFERGFEAFLDKKDIAGGEDWQKRLSQLIAAADTVVFVISPDWLRRRSAAGSLRRAIGSASV